MKNSNVIELGSPDESIDPLTALLRTGARHLIQQAVDIELQELLGEHAQRRLEDGRAGVVRNGYARARDPDWPRTGDGSNTQGQGKDGNYIPKSANNPLHP